MVKWYTKFIDKLGEAREKTRAQKPVALDSGWRNRLGQPKRKRSRAQETWKERAEEIKEEQQRKELA